MFLHLSFLPPPNYFFIHVSRYVIFLPVLPSSTHLIYQYLFNLSSPISKPDLCHRADAVQSPTSDTVVGQRLHNEAQLGTLLQRFHRNEGLLYLKSALFIGSWIIDDNIDNQQTIT